MTKNYTIQSGSQPAAAFQSRYYPQLAMIFVGLLLTANVIGEKPLMFGPIILPAGLLLFPFTYLLGDVLTEVYGFSQSRRVIWMGMLCNLFMACMCKLSIALPAVDTWNKTQAYADVLGTSSKLMAISVFTYFVGELSNAYIVSKLKVRLQGRFFWARALCGSWIGEGIETCLFIPLVFYGTMSNDQLIKFALFYYSFKVIYVFCAMPFVNSLVKLLKKKEQLDIYDGHTNYSPFLTT